MLQLEPSLHKSRPGQSRPNIHETAFGLQNFGSPKGQQTHGTRQSMQGWVHRVKEVCFRIHTDCKKKGGSIKFQQRPGQNCTQGCDCCLKLDQGVCLVCSVNERNAKSLL